MTFIKWYVKKKNNDNKGKPYEDQGRNKIEKKRR